MTDGPGDGASAPSAAWRPPPPAPTPGVAPLRPLSIVEILDAAFAVLRRHPRATLLPAFLVSAVVGLGSLFALLVAVGSTADLVSLDPSDVDTGQLLQVLGPVYAFALAASVLQVVGLVVLTGIVAGVVAEAVIGRPVTPAHVWRRVRPMAWRLVTLALLTAVVVLPLLALCVVLGLWVGVGLSLAATALVLERVGAVSSLGRSWQLVQGSWWRTFGSLLLVALICGAITAVVMVPFSLPELVAPTIDPDTLTVDTSRLVVNAAVATVGRIAAGAVTMPFAAAAISLVYLDRRMRREGLHLALARAAAE